MMKEIVVVDKDLQDLIPGFLKNRETDIEKLTKAIEEEDYETIRIIGHSMKGFGSGYGFHFVTEIGKVIEEAGLKKDLKKANESLERLKLYFANIEIRYE